MAGIFTLEALGENQRFCDRQKELEDLLFYARNGTNVVVYSPRRYGKTSLAKRAISRLADQGVVTARVDFSAVSSVEGAAKIIMAGLFKALHKYESLADKGKRFLKAFTAFRPSLQFNPVTGGFDVTPIPISPGGPIELFKQAMHDLSEFIEKNKKLRFFFVWDEFQELTRLKESDELEGIIRSEIEGLPASFCFVGSRRGILLAMFEDKGRMFFRSAKLYKLDPLPRADMVEYLADSLDQAGYDCPRDVLDHIARASQGYAYYMQHLALELLRLLERGRTITIEDAPVVVARVIEAEEDTFTAMIRDLTANQLQVLKSIAANPGARVMGKEFLRASGVAATSANLSAKRLAELDLVEQDDAGGYRIVDPFLARYLVAAT